MDPAAARVAARARRYGHPLAWFRPGRVVRVRDKMQHGYSYVLEARPGRLGPEFRDKKGKRPIPPGRVLAMGAFEGHYCTDCYRELPREWLLVTIKAGRLAPAAPDPSINQFGLKSRLSLREWRRRGWIIAPDPRGWFQWYMRYWLGRRIPAVDRRQISRWRSFARHRAQVVASLRTVRGPRTRAALRKHRPKQRQALLQWAYDPYAR
jgi:hypothetical protein